MMRALTASCGSSMAGLFNPIGSSEALKAIERLSESELLLGRAGVGAATFLGFLFLLPLGFPSGLPVLYVHALLLATHRSQAGR